MFLYELFSLVLSPLPNVYKKLFSHVYHFRLPHVEPVGADSRIPIAASGPPLRAAGCPAAADSTSETPGDG